MGDKKRDRPGRKKKKKGSILLNQRKGKCNRVSLFLKGKKRVTLHHFRREKISESTNSRILP